VRRLHRELSALHLEGIPCTVEALREWRENDAG